MSKKKAGILISSIILILVVTINLIFGGEGKEEQQQQPQQVVSEQPQQEQPQQEDVIKEPDNIITDENKELNLEQPTTNEQTEENIQNMINEKIQEGIAIELAKIQQESTVNAQDNTTQTQQQVEKVVEDKTNVKVEPVKPVEDIKVVSDGEITNIGHTDLATVIFTKTESVTVVSKVIKKVTVDGVTMTLYELGTEGATYPIKIMVNNSAFTSVKEGDKLNVIYNVYKGASGEDIINIVKVS